MNKKRVYRGYLKGDDRFKVEELTNTLNILDLSAQGLLNTVLSEEITDKPTEITKPLETKDLFEDFFQESSDTNSQDAPSEYSDSKSELSTEDTLTETSTTTEDEGSSSTNTEDEGSITTEDEGSISTTTGTQTALDSFTSFETTDSESQISEETTESLDDLFSRSIDNPRETSDSISRGPFIEHRISAESSQTQQISPDEEEAKSETRDYQTLSTFSESENSLSQTSQIQPLFETSTSPTGKTDLSTQFDSGLESEDSTAQSSATTETREMLTISTETGSEGTTTSQTTGMSTESIENSSSTSEGSDSQEESAIRVRGSFASFRTQSEDEPERAIIEKPDFDLDSVRDLQTTARTESFEINTIEGSTENQTESSLSRGNFPLYRNPDCNWGKFRVVIYRTLKFG